MSFSSTLSWTEQVSILEELCNLLDDEYDTIKTLIRDLPDIVDLDESSYREELLTIVGGDKFIGISSWVANNSQYISKIKGTRPLVYKYLDWLSSGEGVTVRELYKTKAHENTSWSGEGISHTLKSSKITFCTLTCETTDETIDLDDSEYFEKVREVLPINVRPVPSVDSDSLIDSVEVVNTTIGACYTCETICEASCETGDELAPEFSRNTATFSDDLSPFGDTLEFSVRCVSVCESSCVNCCETSCECEPCELFCESGCEAYQTHGAGAGGGGGSCIQVCETECQQLCEDFCQQGCEVDCQCACEGKPCQLSCVDACQEHLCEACTCQCSQDSY